MRIQLAFLGAGVAQAFSGAVRPNAPGTIRFHDDGTNVPVYATETASTADSSGGFVTDEWGRVPGWVDSAYAGRAIDIHVPPAGVLTGTLGGLPGPAGNPKGAYNSGSTYAQGDIVTYNGLPWISLQGSNHANAPDSSPTFWLQLLAAPNITVASGLVTSYGQVDRMARLFGGQGDAGIQYRQVTASDTGPALELLRHVKGEVYERARLREIGSSLAGSYTNYQLDERSLLAPMKSIAFDDGSVVADGGALSFAADSYSYPQGAGHGYYWTHTVGRGGHVTLPAGTTRIGVRFPLRANGGLIAVALSSDGGATWDTTAANLLPTAQDLVNRTYTTGGTTYASAPASILTPTGPFAATDRVLDMEYTNWFNSQITSAGTEVHNFHVLLADHLDPTRTWLVRLLSTGVNNEANAGFSTLNVEAFTYGDPSMTRSTSGCDLVPIRRGWHTWKSAMEYAIDCQPAGASAADLVGNFHGWERQDALELYLDTQPIPASGSGSLTAFTPGSPAVPSWGREASIIRRSTLFHPDLPGGTSWASVVTIYRMSAAGLTVCAQLTLTKNTTFNEWYASMAPMEGRILSRGAHNADITAATFLAQDNSRTKESTDGIVMWDPSGSNLALQWLVADTRKSLLSFPNASTYLGIQDNAPSVGSGAPNSKGNKGYASRATGSNPITASAGQAINLGDALHRLAIVLEPEITLGWGS